MFRWIDIDPKRTVQSGILEIANHSIDLYCGMSKWRKLAIVRGKARAAVNFNPALHRVGRDFDKETDRVWDVKCSSF